MPDRRQVSPDRKCGTQTLVTTERMTETPMDDVELSEMDEMADDQPIAEPEAPNGSLPST